MADLTITNGDLLDALQELLKGKAGGDANGAMTASDISEMLHVDHKRVTGCLRTLKQMGLLEVTRVYRRALDDRIMPVAAYWFKKSTTTEDKEK